MDALIDASSVALELLEFEPSCGCSVHDVAPPAVWFRVLDCGCVLLACDSCAEYDRGIMVRRGMGRCTSCCLIVGVARLERL